MAQHKSAGKRARQAEKRRERNRRVRSSVRTAVKRARSAAAGEGDPVEAARLAESELRRAASKGVIPKTRASRQVSRLARAAHRASAT